MLPSRPAFLLTLLLLAACGRDGASPTDRGPNGEVDGPLPVPAGASGSVTGMPDRPGPGPIGAQNPGPVAPEVALDADGNPLPADGVPVEGALEEGLAVDGNLPGDGQSDGASAEPGGQEAVTVVRDYFAAINSGNFARAYSLWADGGRASGQSPQAFADGFVDTAGISVELMPPGRIAAAAGSRYVEVPVNLRASMRDGGERRLTGSFTLRRAVVDGATAEQRAWRISAADLRDLP